MASFVIRMRDWLERHPKLMREHEEIENRMFDQAERGERNFDEHQIPMDAFDVITNRYGIPSNRQYAPSTLKQIARDYAKQKAAFHRETGTKPVRGGVHGGAIPSWARMKKMDETFEIAWELMKSDEKGDNAPTNPGLWAQAKSKARSKFKVYPSAYANGWAAKWYKSKGGGWKKKGKKGKKK